jgi:2,3-bisphosphoglycerate-independent phosphoglycerate mutase
MDALKRMAGYAGPEGPVVLLIMDGVGIGRHEDGDMVRAAHTPHLDWLATNAITSSLKAHGTAVGMPGDDDMGNSEVGHNAIGCGRVFAQGARLVSEAIASRALFAGQAWREVVGNVTAKGSQLHFIGLFSDGNVHSHLDHLEAMLTQAKAEGVRRARVHILLDGRDVPPTSALAYVERFEAFLKAINADGTVDFAIASGGGRMKVTMDRYEADWRMVDTGWKTHVKGEGDAYASAREAVEALRARKPGILDQDLPAFVIHRDGKPLGPVVDGDSVVFFNFRGDRSIEITRAFEEETFSKFDRGPRPDVVFAGMMQYDGDLMLPKRFLVVPPAIDRTMGAYLAASGVRQLACSETQKFGHVTYFFNGNRSGKYNADLEDYVEVPSDRVPFEERPWMKAAEITDVILKAVRENRHEFIRLNYANGDMVGHTGVFQAVRIAVEAVDLSLGRVMQAVKAAKGILVVSADHGNADDMAERDKKTGKAAIDPATGDPKPKTAHSLNAVPVHVYDPSGVAKARLSAATDLGISSLAATCLRLMGYEPPADYTPSVVDVG